MISQIMEYCNNHFIRSYESSDFEIVADGIEGSFAETYIAGQYVWIQNSFINDGVYKIESVTTGKLTFVDTDLLAENTGQYIRLFGCSIPKPFLSIVTDIETWVAKNSGKEGIASESIDGYSFSFGNGSDGSTANTWQSAFSGRLATYRQISENVMSYDVNGSIGGKWL